LSFATVMEHYPFYYIPLTPSLSPAFAEAASRREAPGEREIYRGINLNPLPLGWGRVRVGVKLSIFYVFPMA
jgi:hypothetical protein